MEVLRTALKYGTYAGLIMTAYVVILILAGQNPYGPWRFPGLILLGYFIFQAVKEFKSMQDPVYMPWFLAFRIGTRTSLFFALLVSIVIYLVIVFFDLGIVDILVNDAMTLSAFEQWQIDVLGGVEITEDQMRESLANPSNLAIGDFISKFWGGIFIAGIVALITKEKTTIPDEQ